MFISKITICNLFAYYGSQSIEFNRAEGKNLYCIYGDNGFGKTSFIRCAKLLFLGTGGISETIPAVVQRFAPKEKNYVRFISGNNGNWRGILNKNALRKYALNEGEEEFFVEFRGEIGKEQFSIKRSWDIQAQYKDNLELYIGNEVYKDDEARYRLNSILPENFVEFFFFDGEEIESISDNLRTELRSKIEDILSINPLKMIDTQARKLRDELIANEVKNKTQQDNLIITRKKLDTIQTDLLSKQNQLKVYQALLAEQEHNINNTNKKLEKLAVDSSREKESLATEKNLKEKELQDNKQLLRERIKSIIFTSNASLIQQLREEIHTIQSSTKKEDIDSLKRLAPQIQSQVNQKLETLQYEASTIEDFKKAFAEILAKMPNALESRISNDFSKLFLYHADTINDVLLRAEFNNPQQQIANIKSLKQEINAIKSQQLELNFDEYTTMQQDELNAQLKEYENKKGHLQTLRDEIIANIGELIKQQDILTKEIYNLEQSINTERIDNKLKMLHFLCKCMEEYKNKLIRKLQQELHDKILEKYKAILPNDNVFSLHIGDDFEIVLRDRYDEPIIVESQSSGQKQILAISIFWALSELSNSKVPIIIDTPLSRIDATNRANIISKYYAQDNQVIILPHSGEIGAREYQYAKPYLAGLYKIHNSENRNQANIKPAEFSEIL